MWRALPIESKRYYKIKGEGGKSRSRKTLSGAFVRKVLNAGVIKT